MKRLLTILLILVAFAGKAQDPSPLPNVNVKKLISPNNPIFYFNPVTYDFWVFMGEYGWKQLKNNEVTSITFGGDATKMLTLQQLYGGTKTATFTDNDNQAPTLITDNLGLTGTSTTVSIAYKEDKVNKENTTVDNSTTKYPTVNLLKTYADSKVSDAAYSGSWDGVTTIAPSKNAVYDKISSLEPINYCATTMTVNYGTLNQGTVSDLCAVGGTDVIIQERVATPPFEITFTFTGVTRLSGFKFYGRYNGGATHNVHVQAYNYTTASWDYLGEFSTTTNKQWFSYSLNLANNYLSGGNAQLRIQHQDSGITTHQMIFDYVNANYGGGGGANFITAGAVDFTPSGNVSSTNVQAAIQELDTEKEPMLTKGNLTESIAGLEFSSTRQVIGGATDLSLTPNYIIPLTASITAYDNHLVNTSNPHNVTKTQVGLSNVTNDAQVKRTEMGTSNGVATLDAGGKVPFTQLPASLMIYKGTWSALTNTPTLTDGVGTSGWVYKNNLAGTVNFGSGNISFYAGDWVIYNGATWERSVGTDNVVSVNGQQGIVNLTTANISENTNLYYTDSRARGAISLTTNGTSGAATYNNSTGVLNVPQYQAAGSYEPANSNIQQHITNDGDLSSTNELQTLSGSGSNLSGYQITLSNSGGTVTLPNEADGSTINEIQAPTLTGDNIGLTQTTTTISIAGKEDKSNKENTTVDNSTTKYPTVNLLKTYADTKDPSATNELNTSVSFNKTNNKIEITDAGGTKSDTIDINTSLLLNEFTGVIPVTTQTVSFNWPVQYASSEYNLDIYPYYTEVIDGKSVEIKNAVYDKIQTATGFSLKVDTVVGFIKYRASRIIHSETPANVVLQSDLTTTVGNPGVDTKIPTEKAVRTALSGVVVTETDPIYSTSSWYNTTNNATNWNTSYTDRLKWDGGSIGLTASTGRTSLGGTTIGSNLFTLTNPSAITFPRFNADNSISALSASDFKIAIGGGTTTNSQIIKFDTGTIENTDLYTFDGSSNKTLDIKAGTGISLTKSANSVTINSSSGSSFDGCFITTTLPGVGITNAYSVIKFNGTDIIDTNNYHTSDERIFARSAGYYEISFSAEITFSQSTVTYIMVELLKMTADETGSTQIREISYQQDENFITSARLNIFFPPIIVHADLNEKFIIRIKANISSACSYGGVSTGLPVLTFKKIQ